MKKVLIVLVGCMIFGACVTLTPEQKRAIFENQVSKPEMQCELKNIGEKPVAPKVSVSLDDVAYYDVSECHPIKAINGFRPVQRINSREVLAYPCTFGCSADEIVHIKFPYALNDLEAVAYYEIPNDICNAFELHPKPYRYTTIAGFTNTVISIKMIKKHIYSKTERQKMLKELQKERQIEAQQKLDERYEEVKKQANESYNICKNVYDVLISKWQTATDTQDYCNYIESILNSMQLEKELYSKIAAYHANSCSFKK